MDSPFQYQNQILHCEDVPLTKIVEECGTPTYVYSSKGILDRYHAYDAAFGEIPHRVCFAVKANSNLAVLHLLANAGAGFDIVSGGELYRVLKAGGSPDHIVFSGVGKTAAEIEYALDSKIHSFNCESEPELKLINEIALRRGVQVRVALRVNPHVDASTHPYISTGLRDHKFGIDIDAVEAIYDRTNSLPALIPEGVSCHIGSQLLDPAPLLEAIQKVLTLTERLKKNGLPIRHLDLGGGLGVAYETSQQTPRIRTYIEQAMKLVAASGLTIMVEPGRSIVAESGALLARVIYRKQSPQKEFVILDAAMNDLIRPALYRAHHEIVPVVEKGAARHTADIVGPVCETGDFLARNRELATMDAGESAAILTAGAYGFVLSSNYNTRTRAAEVLVTGSTFRIVRTRETLEDLVRGETV